MSLPKLDAPLYGIKVPSTSQKINIRPLTVKEEKILLLAQQADSTKQTLLAIKQITNNCIQLPAGTDFNINSLTIFDIEYIFLQLRAKSINNIVTVSYKDNDDQKIYPFEIDLEKITVTVPKKPNLKLKLNDQKTLLLKYPTLDIFDAMSDSSDEEEQLESIAIAVLDKLYDGDEVYEFSQYSKEEVSEFIDSFDIGTFDKIKAFIDGIPSVTHTLSYTNSSGVVKEIVLKGIDDFFI